MKNLYSSPLPESAQSTETDSLGQQVAELGLLDEDGASVESISSEAADLSLEGQIRWGEEISPMLAAELDELADASLSQLPLYQRDSGQYSNRGFYEIESADVTPLHANQRSVWQYSLSLTFVGKRGSKFRAVATNTWQPTHPWGNTMEALVGIPADARKVRWLDRETERVELASPVRTVAGQPIEIALYDVESGEAALGSTEDPVLVYDASYPADVRAGVRVYDTRGYSAKFSEDGGPRRWQVVHSTEHDIEHPLVVSNGILRVTLDEQGSPNITAETWDESAGAWTSVDAVETNGQATDWTLYDIDVMEIGMQDVRLQLGFMHPTEGLFDVNASLQPGREAVLCWNPTDGAEPVPSGLETWLEPIAADWILAPAGERGLVDRTEVRG